MDRRNGDPTAPPPRPPKTFSNQPRVHRPRAPEPDQAAVVPPRPLNRMNSSASSTVSNHRPQPAIPPAQLPTTAPLTPLQHRNINISNRVNYNSSNSSNLMSAPAASTFSRWRQETRPSPSPAPAPTRSITPVQSTNLISTTLGNRTPSPSANNVSLQLPRPENERLPNEYVDTPFTNIKTTVTLSQWHQPPSSVTPNLNQNHSHLNTNISTIDGIRVLNSSQSPQLSVHSSSSEKNILPNRTAVRPNTLPITKQPSFNSNTLTKKDNLRHCQEDVLDTFTLNGSTTNNNGLINSDQLTSISCPQCSRCRCEECQRPRQLPSRWLCGDNCLCSAETIIDYASCLCCVKALYYHCSKDHELDCEADSIRCADDPCSCVPYKRATRWGCLSALSIILPCLLCYWPMRGCVSLCAKCYAKHSRHGCRCNNNQTRSNNNNRLNIISNLSNGAHTAPISHQRRNNNDLTPEKRLLDASNSEY